jgi:hypothetical protein
MYRVYIAIYTTYNLVMSGILDRAASHRLRLQEGLIHFVYHLKINLQLDNSRINSLI